MATRCISSPILPDRTEGLESWILSLGDRRDHLQILVDAVDLAGAWPVDVLSFEVREP